MKIRMQMMTWAGLVVLVLVGTACSRSEAVREDLATLDAFTVDLVSAVESAENPTAGVAAGASLLEERGAAIKEMMTRLGSVRGFQLDDETKKLLAQSLTNNIFKVNGLKIAMLRATMSNAQLSADLDRLIEDYNGLLQTK